MEIKAIKFDINRKHEVDLEVREKLPFSIRVLLECAVRNCDEFQVLKKDVEKILDWENNQGKSIEIPFKPARDILQDFTGCRTRRNSEQSEVRSGTIDEQASPINQHTRSEFTIKQK